MTKCKGSKCKSAADCDDCVVKAARKASAKKTKERNAMLLLKAKILEKMPKQAPVDPFASYRNLPRKQRALAPSPQNLTLQNVADEIERAFARRDKPATLEKRVKREVPEAELESTTWLMPLAAERKAPILSFEPQASSLNIEPRPTVGGFFPEEAPTLEESVMELTDVSEFDDDDAMEALDEAMAPGAAALAASTEEAESDEVRMVSDESFVMDPIWEATLAARVPSLDLSSEPSTLSAAISESGETIAPRFGSFSDIELSTPTEGIGLNLPMDLNPRKMAELKRVKKEETKAKRKERAALKESLASSASVQRESSDVDTAIDESLEVPTEPPYAFI
jgi:hypothetical protein